MIGYGGGGGYDGDGGVGYADVQEEGEAGVVTATGEGGGAGGEEGGGTTPKVTQEVTRNIYPNFPNKRITYTHHTTQVRVVFCTRAIRIIY